MLEALRLTIVGSGLPIDEAEEPLTGRPEEVVTTGVRRPGERGHVGGPLQDGSQRVIRLGAQIEDRLAGIEAFDQQQVHPRIEVLAGRGWRSNVDGERAI